jgi:hypothetical protein
MRGVVGGSSRVGVDLEIVELERVEARGCSRQSSWALSEPHWAHTLRRRRWRGLRIAVDVAHLELLAQRRRHLAMRRQGSGQTVARLRLRGSSIHVCV